MRYIKLFLLISILMQTVSCTAQFNGSNAMEHLEKQCSFGPRVPGTQARDNCADYISDFLSQYADTVYFQRFKEKVSYSDSAIEFVNIIAVFNPGNDIKIMFCSHYDSRPFSDEPGKATPGANDGASSTAVLMETARLLGGLDIDKTIEMVFFDGEDGGRPSYPQEWFIGSKYFAEHYTANKPLYTILIDMIGDRDLDIYKEGFSQLYCPDLNNMVFKTGRTIDPDVFHDRVGYYVKDDHLPLINAGFNAVDIIDFQYKYWHTTEDTPDKCSPRSLRIIGNLIMEIVSTYE